MSPGQRAYIERRIAQLDERAGWLRVAVKESWAEVWHRDELAEYETKISGLRARLLDLE